MCVSLLPATALAAEVAEAAHTHGEDGWTCVEESQLICGYEQEHTHDETCWTASEASEEPVCGLAESEGHQHGEACYTEETVQVCDLEVSEEHEHGEACFVTETALTCGQEEFIVGMERFCRFRRESGGRQKAYAHRQDKKQGKAAFAQGSKNLHAINSSFLCVIVRMQRYPAAGLACRRH